MANFSEHKETATRFARQTLPSPPLTILLQINTYFFYLSNMKSIGFTVLVSYDLFTLSFSIIYTRTCTNTLTNGLQAASVTPPWRQIISLLISRSQFRSGLPTSKIWTTTKAQLQKLSLLPLQVLLRDSVGLLPNHIEVTCLHLQDLA